MRAVYLAYLGVVGATLGWLLHGDPDTYRYIPASIRHYPGAAGVADRLRRAGLTEVAAIPLLAGLMTIHVARAPESAAPLTLLSQGSETCHAGPDAGGRTVKDGAPPRNRPH